MNNIINKPLEEKNNVKNYILDKNTYVDNFSFQWKDFKNTQIDSFNKTQITYDHIKKLLFNNFDLIKNKNIIEIGCGSGRYSEYLHKYSKNLLLCDYSNAIYYNDTRNKNNVEAIRADLFNLPEFSNKFDVVFCRGVLQHLPDPLKGIEILHSLVNKNGIVIFDIYKKPRLSFLNSKYLWRLVIKKIFTYDQLKVFLENNICKILSIRWAINSKLGVNLNYFFDYIFPIYDYKEKLPLSKEQLLEWAILDTLDGLITEYDKPFSYKEILKYFDQKKIKLIKHDSKISSYISQNK